VQILFERLQPRSEPGYGQLCVTQFVDAFNEFEMTILGLLLPFPGRRKADGEDDKHQQNEEEFHAQSAGLAS